MDELLKVMNQKLSEMKKIGKTGLAIQQKRLSISKTKRGS